MNHLVLEIYGIQQFQLTDLFDKIIDEIGATKLNEFGHNFGSKDAYTHVTMLAESHMSIHTWPENKYAAYDLFFCSEYSVSAVTEMVKNHFQTDNVISKVIKRDPFDVVESLTTNKDPIAA